MFILANQRDELLVEVTPQRFILVDIIEGLGAVKLAANFLTVGSH